MSDNPGGRKINIRYIRRVLKFIEGDLRRLDMQIWGEKPSPAVLAEENENYAACGTKACFAGWGYLLQFPKSKWPSLFKFDDIDPAYGHYKNFSMPAMAKKFGFTSYEARGVFGGSSLGPSNPREQLVKLKRDINQVLIKRGLRVRV